MIDLHCHILPEMDDGAKSYDEAVEMVRNAKKNRINIIIATPHFTDYDEIDYFIEMRNEKAVMLNSMSKEFGCNVSIGCGAEVFLDSRVFTAGELDGLTINGSKYLLCEYTLKPFDTEKSIVYAEEICQRGYTPIIAHPERYVSFFENPEVMNELWDLGCRFQVNASSLAGHGGEMMQEFTKDLILRGFVDFIATDAHAPKGRSNKILKRIEDFPEEISNEQIDYLTTVAPLKVIKKEEFETRKVKYF